MQEVSVFECYLPDEPALLKLAGDFAAVCAPGTIIYLSGDLGAGKTCWTRGFLQALGYTGKVKSPTYTLVEIYSIAGQTITHFDLYRITQSNELDFIGIEDYFAGNNTVIIEWPERGMGKLPPADLQVQLEILTPGRKLSCTAHSEQGKAIIHRLKEGIRTC